MIETFQAYLIFFFALLGVVALAVKMTDWFNERQGQLHPVKEVLATAGWLVVIALWMMGVAVSVSVDTGMPLI